MTADLLTSGDTTTEIREQWHIRVIGTIWMPSTTCAMEYVVDHPMQLPAAEDETDDQYEARMAECAANTGDFACLDAVEVERSTTVTTFRNGRRVSNETTWTMLQEFTEEDRMTFGDCMFGGFDE